MLTCLRAAGIWISDESSQLPESTTYIGADIAPHLFPPNPPSHTKFITQSIKDAWPAEYHSAFDLVHQRLVLACCDEFEAKIAVQRLVELAKPGAWIQLMECDHSGAFSAEVAETHPALLQFGKLVISHLAKKGQCAQQGLHLKRYLTDAGALDVTEVILDIPVGASAADPTIGQVAANNLVEVAGKMQGDAQFVEQLKQELNNVGGTQRFHVVYGRRPA